MHEVSGASWRRWSCKAGEGSQSSNDPSIRALLKACSLLAVLPLWHLVLSGCAVRRQVAKARSSQVGDLIRHS
jgi:hypothetical protein